MSPPPKAMISQTQTSPENPKNKKTEIQVYPVIFVEWSARKQVPRRVTSPCHVTSRRVPSRHVTNMTPICVVSVWGCCTGIFFGNMAWSVLAMIWAMLIDQGITDKSMYPSEFRVRTMMEKYGNLLKERYICLKTIWLVCPKYILENMEPILRLHDLRMQQNITIITSNYVMQRFS